LFLDNILQLCGQAHGHALETEISVMSVKHMLLACVFAPLALSAAQAQTWNATSDTSMAPVPAPSPAASSGLDAAAAPAVAVAKTADKGPELNALRYYAHSRDLNRVAAEIRRIKLDYPNWNPPEDLYTDEKPRVDEQPLWDLYLKKDYAGVDAKMAEMKAANPAWIPTHDFSEKFAHAKASATIAAAYDQKQWNDVVATATHQDGLVNCGEIDLAWRIAEGFARSGDEAKATDIYGFILTSCTNAAARMGTVQKASDVLTDPAKFDQLVAMGKKSSDGSNEFAPIVEGRIRADLGEFAAGKSTTAVSPERVAAFEKATIASKKADDALLLGWYYRKTRDHEKALNWTRTAYQGDANVKTAEAYALALREAYNFEDAEKLTHEWRDKGDQFRKLYIDIVSTSITSHGHDAEIMRRQSEQETQAQAPVQKELAGSKGDVYGQAFDRPMVYCGQQRPLTPAEIERLLRFKVEVETDKSALGGQAMGWRLYEANLPTDAAFWFEHSMIWAPNAPAAVGLAVTAKRFHQLGVYRALLAKYGATYPELLAISAKQRNCVNDQGGVASNRSAPGRLFSSITQLTAPTEPAGGTNPGYASLTGGSAALQEPAPVVATALPLAMGAAPKDPNGLLTPSDVNPTEIRAAVETPERTYTPRRRHIVRRHLATQARPTSMGRGYFGY
jgi:hypothetical protein